jgi:hypothetical protein
MAPRLYDYYAAKQTMLGCCFFKNIVGGLKKSANFNLTFTVET